MTGTEYRAQREALRLTQSELAERLGVSRRTIVRLETTADEVPRVDELAIKYLAGAVDAR